MISKTSCDFCHNYLPNWGSSSSACHICESCMVKKLSEPVNVPASLPGNHELQYGNIITPVDSEVSELKEENTKLKARIAQLEKTLRYIG
jgi:hypothetical protein